MSLVAIETSTLAGRPDDVETTVEGDKVGGDRDRAGAFVRLEVEIGRPRGGLCAARQVDAQSDGNRL